MNPELVLSPWEQEAELAFNKSTEIEEAGRWCRTGYPHRFEFLNQIWRLLVAEEHHFARLGLSTAARRKVIKHSPILAILSPSQALRLLECYKRAQLDTLAAWRAPSIKELERIEADHRRDQVIEQCRAKISRSSGQY